MNTEDLKIGDSVYGSFGSYGALDVKAGKVIKVTPSKQITADFGEVWRGNGQARPRRFNRFGREIGGEYRGGYLIDAETFARLLEKQKAANARNARNAIMAHLRSWSFSNKAELNALVARLVELAALVPDDKSVAPCDSVSHPQGENGEAG